MKAQTTPRWNRPAFDGLNNMDRKITKNFIFRWFECGFNQEETAKLCFVSVTEVTLWDERKEIPLICQRVMRMAAGRELPSIFERYWAGWRMSGYHLITPAGSQMTRQRLEVIDMMGKEDFPRWRNKRVKYRLYRR
ncbi:regulator [Aeromonas sp. 1805]|uniref:DUF3653 domain-containing protein n=1 Tax=Aeromonas sp. 1805 TaxID=2560028 RepID=UPI00148B230D|nr:DUF3653 domain-containing protein [Aeromonas sp. 1805]QJT19123.1 regulator [Aeromonas sp. 1805]